MIYILTTPNFTCLFSLLPPSWEMSFYHKKWGKCKSMFLQVWRLEQHVNLILMLTTLLRWVFIIIGVQGYACSSGGVLYNFSSDGAWQVVVLQSCCSMIWLFKWWCLMCLLKWWCLASYLSSDNDWYVTQVMVLDQDEVCVSFLCMEFKLYVPYDDNTLC